MSVKYSSAPLSISLHVRFLNKTRSYRHTFHSMVVDSSRGSGGPSSRTRKYNMLESYSEAGMVSAVSHTLTRI